YSNSNDLAFAIALSFPLCLMFLLTTRSRFRKVLWTAGLLAMGAALVMTASRGGLITFVITAVICLWHFGVKGKRFYLIAATGLAGVILIGAAGKTLMDRMATLWGNDIHSREQLRAEKSIDERQFVIDKALEGIAEHPLLGLGTRNFETYSTIWLEVHMTYLQIAVEGGIPSLILFLAFFIRGFKNVRILLKRKDLSPELKLVTGALHSVQIGFAVGALFSPEAYQFFPFFSVSYTSALLAYVRESDRAAASVSNPPLPKPVRKLSGAFVNEGKVLVNP